MLCGWRRTLLFHELHDWLNHTDAAHRVVNHGVVPACAIGGFYVYERFVKVMSLSGKACLTRFVHDALVSHHR